MGKCLGGNCSGRNFMGGISWWGNCLEGACPGGNHSRLIVQPAKVRRIIILGENFIGVIDNIMNYNIIIIIMIHHK